VITEQDLQAAIAECQGVRNPTSSTCIKLAAFYTIQEHLFGTHNEEVIRPTYSYAEERVETVHIDSDSEFSQRVNGMNASDVWPVIDELMQTISVINPRLYASVLRKLE